MCSRRVICSVIMLAVIADFALGQGGYEGRQRRPANPGYPSGCPPVCSLYCPTGFKRDFNGCSICECNQQCPRVTRRCDRRGTDYCSAQNPCPSGSKCCQVNCSMQCVAANYTPG